MFYGNEKMNEKFLLFLLRRLVLQWTCSTRTVMVRHWVINRWCLFCDRCCLLLFLFRLFFSSGRWCLIVWFWVIVFCLTWFLFWTSKFTYPYVCVFCLMICFWFPVVVYNLDIIVSVCLRIIFLFSRWWFFFCLHLLPPRVAFVNVVFFG